MSNVSSNKKAGVAAPASVQSNVTTTNEVSTMNNSIVAVRKAFDNADVATLAATHHSTLKAALPSDDQMNMLYTMFARSEFEPPKWLERYEQKVEAGVAKAVARQPVHHISLGRKVLESTKEAEQFVPLLLGKVTPAEWAAEINSQPTITTRNGYEISAAANMVWGSQFSMTKLAMALKAAVDVKGMNPIEATRVANEVHDQIDRVITAFAAVRKINHRELVMADVTLVTQHGQFDEPTEATDWEQVLREEGLGWDEIDEYTSNQELERISQQNELINRNDRASEDEGRLQTALHDFGQLLELDPTKVFYAESSYAQVALIGKDWPRANPMWGDLETRLAEAWANAIEWAETPEEIARAEANIEKRAPALADLHAKPMKARWVINHASRRVWRDKEALRIRREQYVERIDQIIQDKYLNERYQVPVGGNRRRDEGKDNDRIINLYYREVAEADVSANHQQMIAFEHSFDGLNGESVKAMKHLAVYDEEGETEQADGEIRFWGAVVEELDALLPKLESLHADLRELDDAMAVIWSTFVRDGMPDQPPMYWNRNGWYLTHEDALAALHVEMKEMKAQLRVKDADALTRAAALIAENFGVNV